MVLTYLDSGVLIALAQGAEEGHAAANALVGDASRSFASSDMVWLETVPMAPVRGGPAVRAIYELYFARRVSVLVAIDRNIVSEARGLAEATGIGGADAIHAAAALSVKAMEFITTERTTKPLFRLGGITVRRL